MQSNNFLNFYNKGRWLFFKLFVCLCFCFLLLVFDKSLFINRYIKYYISALFYPITYIVNKPIEWTYNITQYFKNQKLLIEHYKIIEKNYTIKSIKLNMLIDIEKKYNELQKIFKIKNINSNIKLARILPNKNVIKYQILINKGSLDNIKMGQAVATIDGLIGQITSVEPMYSQVTLINNDKVVIPAKVERTGFKILVYGNQNSLEIPYFPSNEDLQADDLIVTSGIDDNFPSGIPVATIEKTEKSVSIPYFIITAKPTAKIENVDYVIILPLNNE